MTRSTTPRTCIRTRRFVRVLVAPGSFRKLAKIRHELAVWLGSHPRQDDTIRIVVELVENAFVHGSKPGGRVTLEVERLDEGQLSILVRDAGRTTSDAPRVTTPGFDHGLRIVEDLSERIDTTVRRNRGRTVRAILAAQAPPIVEPDVDLETLLKAYPDGEPDHDNTSGGGDRVS